MFIYFDPIIPDLSLKFRQNFMYKDNTYSIIYDSQKLEIT